MRAMLSSLFCDLSPFSEVELRIKLLETPQTLDEASQIQNLKSKIQNPKSKNRDYRAVSTGDCTAVSNSPSIPETT
ncbi:hypothetical protein O77CONTIG1_01635 [Leptolyngbya sp. O-77]|nr:hypothetical protein O77CONTIG1_01635 [Leptolyngbya sp. O-77]